MRNPAAEKFVDMPVGPRSRYGKLTVPLESTSLVVFAQGGGSGIHNPRNRYVARLLNESNLATLLIDLLTVEEQEIDLSTELLRLNIALLAERVIGAGDWVAQYPDTNSLRIGYFGTDTGTAAAMEAAAVRSCDRIERRPSRSGRYRLGPRQRTDAAHCRRKRR